MRAQLEVRWRDERKWRWAEKQWRLEEEKGSVDITQGGGESCGEKKNEMK